MGEKTANPGHFTIPAMPAAGVGVTSGAANTLTTTYVALTATTPSALYITGVVMQCAIASTTGIPTYCAVQIAAGTTGAEAIIDQQNIPISYDAAITATRVGAFVPIAPPVPVATATRIAAKTADSVGAEPWLIQLTCIAQASVVDDTVVESANTVQIAGVTSKGTAGYVGVDWAQISAPTTVQGLTGTTISATQAVASVTGAVGSVTGAVGSVTAAVTVGTNNDKTGYSLTQTFPTNFSAIVITTGGHISNVDTLTTYTGNTPQTGDAFARIGVAGVGLTNLGDTRIANLDAAVSTRSTLANPVTVGTNNDKTGYSLTQSFPSNFATLVIDATGGTTVSINNDKTGYGITSNVKKNSQFLSFMFVMTDSTNHAPLAGLSVTATRSLDGGVFGACANAVTGIASGWYKIDLAATDTNANRVALLFTAPGADATNIEINTQP